MSVKLLSTANGIIKTGNSKNFAGKPAIETLTIGFFTVDQKWIVKYWNKAAEKILKVEAKDIVGFNLWEKFAGSFPLEFYTVYYKAFLEDTPVHFEEYWGEMGAWFDVITYYSDDTLSVSFKSSNHPHAEYPEDPVQRMNTLTELYRFVTEITNDCLWEWDLANKEIFWIDGGHKRVLGYQIENALIPQSFWENCIHPEDKGRVMAGLNKVLGEGTQCEWKDEYRFKKASGEYAYVCDRGHIIYGDDNVAQRMIGATQDITEKVLLHNKFLQEIDIKQKEITWAALTAQENERAEIGKELHDNLNQILAVAQLYLQLGRKNELNREAYLDKSSDFIVKVIEEIRKISKKLVIPCTHIIGLCDNISNLIQDLAEAHSIKIEFQNHGLHVLELEEKFQVNIYRIIQEQVNNILKHADATSASINLSRQENTIILSIKDNGKGCNILPTNNGVGIINIQSRACVYDGIVTTTSKPGEGFELKIEFPFADQLFIKG